MPGLGASFFVGAATATFLCRSLSANLHCRHRVPYRAKTFPFLYHFRFYRWQSFAGFPNWHRLPIKSGFFCQKFTDFYRFLPIFTATAKLCYPGLLPLTDYLSLAQLESRGTTLIRYKRYSCPDKWRVLAVNGVFWRVLACDIFVRQGIYII